MGDAQTTPYDDDVYAWSQEQAGLLRALLQQPHPGARPLPNALDLPNIAEEIESLGSEQLFQVQSRLVQAMAHLIKLAVAPDAPSARGWEAEIVAALDTAASRYRASMRQKLEPDVLWRRAVRRATARKDDADAWPPLPEACPFAPEDLLDEAAGPRDLAARIVAPPPGA